MHYRRYALGGVVRKALIHIAAHRDAIAAETQATAWSDTPAGHCSEVSIDGMPLVIAFGKNLDEER